MSTPLSPELRRKSATLTALTAIGATMMAITVASSIPAFWRGLLTGVWLSGTLVLIGWQVRLQWGYRQSVK